MILKSRGESSALGLASGCMVRVPRRLPELQCNCSEEIEHGLQFIKAILLTRC
jgi:hypothetical protein